MHYNKKIFAQELGKGSTPEEQKLWEILRNRKCISQKFRRQHVLEGFIVDFYCHERLAIEVDGKVHQRQKGYDTLRQRLIEENGIRFIRITNEEINNAINVVLNKVKRFLAPPLPSVLKKSGRGGRG